MSQENLEWAEKFISGKFGGGHCLKETVAVLARKLDKKDAEIDALKKLTAQHNGHIERLNKEVAKGVSDYLRLLGDWSSLKAKITKLESDLIVEHDTAGKFECLSRAQDFTIESLAKKIATLEAQVADLKRKEAALINLGRGGTTDGH